MYTCIVTYVLVSVKNEVYFVSEKNFNSLNLRIKASNNGKNKNLNDTKRCVKHIPFYYILYIFCNNISPDASKSNIKVNLGRIRCYNNYANTDLQHKNH